VKRHEESRDEGERDHDLMPPTPNRRHGHRHGQIVAGVSGQIAARLGVNVNLIRLSFVVLTFAGGAGWIAYAVGMWVFREPEDLELAARSETDTWQAVALAAFAIGALLLARLLGLWFYDAVAWPVAAMAVGLGVIWLPAPRVRPGFVVAGSLLLAGGVGALVVHFTSWATLRTGAIGVAVLAALVGIAAAPWRNRSVPTLGETLADVAAEVAGEYGVAVDVTRRDDFALAGLEPLVVAAREGMRNAARHSGAPRVSVVLQRNGTGPSVLVRDRGQGFTPNPRATSGGLVSVVRRPIEAAGGTARVRSRPGMGCELELVLPRGRTGAR
jgi:phage shock protein PspC (stress-responsive transcriptional regulator)